MRGSAGVRWMREGSQETCVGELSVALTVQRVLEQSLSLPVYCREIKCFVVLESARDVARDAIKVCVVK